MDGVSQIFDQARSLFEHHMPVASTAAVTAGAAVTAFIGLSMSVLGAKLARIAITLGLVFAGALAGGFTTLHADIPVPIAAGFGALFCGAMGFVLYRFWVGVLTGLLLITAASGSYGLSVLGPELASYSEVGGTAPMLVSEDFTTPSPEAQRQYLNPQFSDWARGFWDHVTARNKTGVKKVALVDACAGIFGLLLGLIAVRFTLVTMTALAGTALFSFGAFVLANRVHPQFYQAGMEHPQAIAFSCGAMLVASLILQTLLTRPKKSATAAIES